MSTLTYSGGNLAAPETETRTPEHKSLWRRMYEAFVTAQQRRAEREVARYLASHGGLITDDIEREIMRRLANGGGRF
jgi:hypothetical protein